MTRNLYLGTDLTPILTAPSQPALFAAVAAAWAQVQSNDFPARAQALADEIAAAEPDLVGLQEAMLFRTDVPPDGPATPAETVAYDFVDLLVAALAQARARLHAGLDLHRHGRRASVGPAADARRPPHRPGRRPRPQRRRQERPEAVEPAVGRWNPDGADGQHRGRAAQAPARLGVG